MAITKLYMPLESLKPLQESRFGVSVKSVVLCTLQCTRSLWMNKGLKQAKNIMWGSEFLLINFFYQDKELQL